MADPIVQSIRFARGESPRSVNEGRGWDVVTARAWLRANNHPAPVPTRTPNQLRFRQTFHGDLHEKFRTETAGLPAGVQVVESLDGPQDPLA